MQLITAVVKSIGRNMAEMDRLSADGYVPDLLAEIVGIRCTAFQKPMDTFESAITKYDREMKEIEKQDMEFKELYVMRVVCR